jgi:DNA-binding SARP family transcriptional activator
MAMNSGKAEALLCHLALRYGHRARRDVLLEALWPDSPATLAGQSLNSLIHSLRKSLSDAIQGQSPILYGDGIYRLNSEAGVGLDVAYFDDLVNEGAQRLTTDARSSAAYYLQAVHLYRGDLCVDTDVRALVERERLQARFLTVLAHLGDYFCAIHDYTLCLHYARRLLEYDACREDAHRLVMRCYVRLGERAQALRQYRLCERILRAEYNAAPERRTTLLYDQVRLDPDSI